MANFKLYGMGESGNAYKASLMLELCDLDWEPEFVDFFKGACRTEEFLALNPMGEVPVLVHGEITLTQSGVMQDYIIRHSGKFAPNSDADAREVMRWVLWDNHKMSSQAGTARFLMNFLQADKRSDDVIAFMQGRLIAALKVLNKHLENRDWIVGDSPTAADFSNCGYLFFEEPFGFNRSEFPNIDRWLSNISSLPGWKHPYDLLPRALK